MHVLNRRLLLHNRLQRAPVSRFCILLRQCKSWRLLALLYLLIKQSHLPCPVGAALHDICMAASRFRLYHCQQQG